MKRKDIKIKAQDELLGGMRAAFHWVEDSDLDESLLEEIKEEMSKQMARVEKLFGVDPYSTSRGV